MYIMLLKASPDYMLSDNFSSSEFMCRCKYSDCNHSFVLQKTIDSAQLLRRYLNIGLSITSGYRCQRHNSVVKGKNNSYHMKGNAVDFVVPNNMSIGYFAEAARMFFDVVIEYPDQNFIHCHNL